MAAQCVPDRIIVFVHGVHAHGAWGTALRERLRTDLRFDATRFINLRFPTLWGVVAWLETWLPWMRHRHTNWMRRNLEDIVSDAPFVPLTIVAHSYGTWFTYHALRMAMEAGTPIRVRTLVLIASVLKTHDRLEVVQQGIVQRLINHWSSNDTVIALAPPPFGKSGVVGFHVPTPDGVVNSVDWLLGHGGYFTNESFLSECGDALAH